MGEQKITCKYCALKTECKRRKHKESYEQAGWKTRCEMGKPIEDKWSKRKAVGQRNARRR